jgi:hypothetical protein
MKAEYVSLLAQKKIIHAPVRLHDMGLVKVLLHEVCPKK